MHIRRISVAKYPYPFTQGNYYPIRIRENCGYPQNINRRYIIAHLCRRPTVTSKYMSEYM